MSTIWFKEKYYLYEFLSLLSLLLVVIPIIFYYETLANIELLFSLSCFLLILISLLTYIVCRNNIAINPFSVFSFMYSGFAFGGIYYSFSDGYFGKFVGFIGIGPEMIEYYLLYGQLFSILCYCMFALGYIPLHKKNTSFVVHKGSLSSCGVLLRLYPFIASPLIIIGFAYWVWVCYQVAGGLIEAFMLFQVFPHLVKEQGLSTLPYHLYYAGVYILLLGKVLNDKRLGFIFLWVSMFGFFISISTARVTISITFILVQVFIIYLLRPDCRKILLNLIFSMFLFAFVIYFLRLMSNSYFLGVDFDVSDIEFFKTIIGGGNITDLQQLVVIFHAFDLNNLMLGSTYFDWMRNTFGGLFGIEPSSVGLYIKENYVPENSGAPTPSAIGEAYVNFLYGAPIFIFFIGILFALVNNWINKKKNILLIFIYSNFVVKFIFMYPKVDSTMFANFFWSSFPTLAIILCLNFLLFFHRKVNAAGSSFDIRPPTVRHKNFH